MSLKPSVLQYAGAGAQLLPPLAALFAGKPRHPARRWILAWCLALTAESILSRLLGLRHINNMWVSYLSLPITSSMVLLGLAFWQTSPIPRLAFRWAVPFVLGVSLALTLRFESTHTFSLVAAPFHGVVLLLSALWTLLRLAMLNEGSLVQRDWFWILTGLVVYAGTSAAVQPLGWYLLGKREDLLLGVWSVSAGASILAFCAIAGGMLCPENRSSGGSLFPRYSASSSSRPDWPSP